MKLVDQANKFKNASDDLDKKLKRLDLTIRNITPVQVAISGNLDYSEQFDENDRLKEKLKYSLNEHNRIAAEKKKLDEKYADI